LKRTAFQIRLWKVDERNKEINNYTIHKILIYYRAILIELIDFYNALF